MCDVMLGTTRVGGRGARAALRNRGPPESNARATARRVKVACSRGVHRAGDHDLTSTTSEF